MVANAAKTAMIVFRSGSRKDPVTIELSGERITESSHEKLLGIFIQSDLKWNKQVDKMTSDVHYALSILRRLVHHLGQKELKKVKLRYVSCR